MQARIVFAGYAFRFRCRTIKKKKKRNGRTRGRYEGEYVYLEVTYPTGKKKDRYIGPRFDLAAMQAGRRVENPAAAAAELELDAWVESGGSKYSSTPPRIPQRGSTRRNFR